jgi:glycogen operon protein
VKLIAEPWDIGEGGYQVGEFPPGWTEWNGKYRDCIRDYWREQIVCLQNLQNVSQEVLTYTRMMTERQQRVLTLSAHDGFTLHDLVTYNQKHNDLNKEESRDGENHNRSWNCGVEGPSGDPEIERLKSASKTKFSHYAFFIAGSSHVACGR